MKRDLSLKLYPESYVVLDIETTGFDVIKNEIIELSAIKVKDGKIIDEFSELVKPLGYLSWRITNLTGITAEMLQDAEYINDVILRFNEFCKDQTVIGHNINFDLKFIDAKLFECHKIHFENDFVDTLKLARKYLSELPSRKLEILAEYFQLDNSGMHRALKDCEVTNICYQKLTEIAKRKTVQSSASAVSSAILVKTP